MRWWDDLLFDFVLECAFIAARFVWLCGKVLVMVAAGRIMGLW